jgi:hypothetical protein
LGPLSFHQARIQNLAWIGDVSLEQATSAPVHLSLCSEFRERLRKSRQNVPAMRSNVDVARKIGFVLSICAFILKSQGDPSFAIRALMA